MRKTSLTHRRPKSNSFWVIAAGIKSLSLYRVCKLPYSMPLQYFLCLFVWSAMFCFCLRLHNACWFPILKTMLAEVAISINNEEGLKGCYLQQWTVMRHNRLSYNHKIRPFLKQTLVVVDLQENIDHNSSQRKKRLLLEMLYPLFYVSCLMIPNWWWNFVFIGEAERHWPWTRKTPLRKTWICMNQSRPEGQWWESILVTDPMQTIMLSWAVKYRLG